MILTPGAHHRNLEACCQPQNAAFDARFRNLLLFVAVQQKAKFLAINLSCHA